jgi:TIR domain
LSEPFQEIALAPTEGGDVNMGYLPQFKNDLFISYRRVSNEAQDKWVDAFCRALGSSLKELVGDVKIWRDEDQLRTGQPWRLEVQQALADAAIFLAIISRTYLDSDECRKELDRFLECLKDPERGSQRKIVPIFKQPPKPEQELPHEIGEIHYHNFYLRDPPGSSHFRELSPSADDVDSRAFWETLARVAQDLMAALEELMGLARQRALGKVFIACANSELQLERERLRSDLQQRGYLVVPEHEYLWNADDHRDRITRDLEESLLCIHLVACTASIEPAAASHARLQLQLAYEAMKRKAKHAPMVWIQPASKVDASASELIDYVKRDLANKEVEYWQGGLEDFKTQIYDILPPVLPKRPLSLGREIALLVEEGDVEEVSVIRALMVDKLALEPKPIKFAGTLPNDAERLARTLASCEQGLIFWARQPEEWVLDLLDYQELSGHLGPDKMSVYVAGPDRPEKRSFRTRKARTIWGLDGLNEPELQAFFQTRSSAT